MALTVDMRYDALQRGCQSRVSELVCTRNTSK